MGRFCIPLNNGKVTQGLPLSDHVVLNIGEPVYPSPFKASPGALGVIYTCECVFEPWSDCPAPDLERAKAAGQITSPKVRFPYSFWDTNLPVAKVGIDWIRKSQSLWQGRTTWFSGNVHGVISKVLFRPRPWVRRLSKGTLREYGLVEQRFAALHIRESVEKQNELGKKLPSHASYETIAETVMREYNVSHLFLHTASPGALSELTRWACATRTVLAFTHNPRSEHV